VSRSKKRKRRATSWEETTRASTVFIQFQKGKEGLEERTVCKTAVKSAREKRILREKTELPRSLEPHGFVPQGSEWLERERGKKEVRPLFRRGLVGGMTSQKPFQSYVIRGKGRRQKDRGWRPHRPPAVLYFGGGKNDIREENQVVRRPPLVVGRRSLKERGGGYRRRGRDTDGSPYKETG